MHTICESLLLPRHNNVSEGPTDTQMIISHESNQVEMHAFSKGKEHAVFEHLLRYGQSFLHWYFEPGFCLLVSEVFEKSVAKFSCWCYLLNSG